MWSWKGYSRLTMASGALANSPPRKRHMKIVCKFWATATGIWKIAKTNIPRNSGRFRPYNSDRGPKIIGPKAKPSTNKLTPNTINSEETPNLLAVVFVAVLKTEEPKVTQIVISPSIMVITHFLHAGKFFGFSYNGVRPVHARNREVGCHAGSFGPSQSTIMFSFSLSGVLSAEPILLSNASGTSYVSPSSNIVRKLSGSCAAPRVLCGDCDVWVSLFAILQTRRG